MLKTVGNPSVRYGDQTVVDGNFVVGTAGKGVDFSASGHAPGMTSELLNDYEEGTWTPTITAGAGTFTSVSATGRYTKIGRQVTVQIRVSITNKGTATGSVKYDLPFTATNHTYAGAALELNAVGATGFTWVYGAQGSIVKYDYIGQVIENGYVWDATVTYFV